MKDNDKEYITIPQLAKILGLTRMAVYKKVRKGEIKAIKIGRTHAIPKAFLKKNVINIMGKPLSEEEKKRIEEAVDKTIEEYGEVLKLLGSD